LSDKTNVLWIGAVIVLGVSLVFAPGISKLVLRCQQKKEKRNAKEVVYVRNPGESTVGNLGLRLFALTS
jgi:hypothetical protein